MIRIFTLSSAFTEKKVDKHLFGHFGSVKDAYPHLLNTSCLEPAIWRWYACPSFPNGVWEPGDVCLFNVSICLAQSFTSRSNTFQGHLSKTSSKTTICCLRCPERPPRRIHRISAQDRKSQHPARKELSQMRLRFQPRWLRGGWLSRGFAIPILFEDQTQFPKLISGLL